MIRIRPRKTEDIWARSSKPEKLIWVFSISTINMTISCFKWIRWTVYDFFNHFSMWMLISLGCNWILCSARTAYYFSLQKLINKTLINKLIIFRRVLLIHCGHSIDDTWVRLTGRSSIRPCQSFRHYRRQGHPICGGGKWGHSYFSSIFLSAIIFFIFPLSS